MIIDNGHTDKQVDKQANANRWTPFKATQKCRQFWRAQVIEAYATSEIRHEELVPCTKIGLDLWQLKSQAVFHWNVELQTSKVLLNAISD